MKKRIKRLRSLFKRLKIDAYLVTQPEKVRYLTGFNSMDWGPCLVLKDEIYLVVGTRDAEQARREAPEVKLIVINYGPGVLALFRENLLPAGLKVGVEEDCFFNEIEILRENCPQNEFLNCKNLIDQLSAVKFEDEIEKIEKAQRLVELVFEKHILPEVRPGISESELSAKISYFGRIHGAEGDSFLPIVVSGERACIPHARPSLKKLNPREVVQFDFGFVMDGYFSDFSRVVFLGKPDKKAKEAYQAVLEAQSRAIETLRAGIAAEKVDRAARSYLESKNYNFPHATGHGLGIMIHTFPRLAPREKVRLKVGYVVTIEPGVYLPGWGGIRIEDVLVITKTGSSNLTRFTKEMIIID